MPSNLEDKADLLNWVHHAWFAPLSMKFLQ